MTTFLCDSNNYCYDFPCTAEEARSLRNVANHDSEVLWKANQWLKMGIPFENVFHAAHLLSKGYDIILPWEKAFQPSSHSGAVEGWP